MSNGKKTHLLNNLTEMTNKLNSEYQGVVEKWFVSVDQRMDGSASYCQK